MSIWTPQVGEYVTAGECCPEAEVMQVSADGKTVRLHWETGEAGWWDISVLRHRKAANRAPSETGETR